MLNYFSKCYIIILVEIGVLQIKNLELPLLYNTFRADALDGAVPSKFYQS